MKYYKANIDCTLQLAIDRDWPDDRQRRQSRQSYCPWCAFTFHCKTNQCGICTIKPLVSGAHMCFCVQLVRHMLHGFSARAGQQGLTLSDSSPWVTTTTTALPRTASIMPYNLSQVNPRLRQCMRTYAQAK